MALAQRKRDSIWNLILQRKMKKWMTHMEGKMGQGLINLQWTKASNIIVVGANLERSPEISCP